VSRSLESVLTPDQLQDLLASAFPGADVPRVTDVTETGCRVRLMGHERHGRPGGTVSGPAMMTLADTAA